MTLLLWQVSRLVCVTCCCRASWCGVNVVYGNSWKEDRYEKLLIPGQSWKSYVAMLQGFMCCCCFFLCVCVATMERACDVCVLYVWVCLSRVCTCTSWEHIRVAKQKRRKGRAVVDTPFSVGHRWWAECEAQTSGLHGGGGGSAGGMSVHVCLCVCVKEKWGCAICERMETVRAGQAQERECERGSTVRGGMRKVRKSRVWLS